MTRVAVVGVGVMGKNHVRVYREMPEVELVAVVDQDQATAEHTGRIYNAPVYSDYCEMVYRERPDAVSVAVPTQGHFSVVKQLLEAGCHVLVEKPIATTLVEVLELIQTAERTGRVLMVGHVERFNPAVIELKRRLEQHELGRVFQIHARRLGPYPRRIQDVGVVMDLATHDLDIMRYLIGSEVVRVFAETRRELHSNFEDLFVGTLRFANGTVALLEINWLTPTKIRELYVTGDRGMFRVNYLTQDLCFFENAETNGHDWSALSLLRGVSEGSMMQFAIQKKEPLRAELEAFISQVQGTGASIVNGYDAKATLTLAMSLIESAMSGEVIRVNQNEGIRNSAKKSTSRNSTSGLAAIPALQAGD
jgi:UDP-N-acetylglucosamine 3-dehydrogenase